MSPQTFEPLLPLRFPPTPIKQKTTYGGEDSTEAFLRHLILKGAGTSCLRTCEEKNVYIKGSRGA